MTGARCSTPPPSGGERTSEETAVSRHRRDAGGNDAAARATTTSCYATMSDGVALAVYLFLPRSRPGTGLPALLCMDRYHLRSSFRLDYGAIRFEPDGTPLLPPVTGAPDDLLRQPWLQSFLDAGFAVALVDIRGSGASFGPADAPFGRRECMDAAEIIAWLARRDWCNGRIGMFGRSYRGITQYLAASEAPAGLQAIAPEMAMFDLYDYVWQGGALWRDAIEKWCRIVALLDTSFPAVPVDGDEEGRLVSEARATHRMNRDLLDMVRASPYRDSIAPHLGGSPYCLLNPARVAASVNASRTPCLHIAGWFDMWTRDMILWFANLAVPQILVIGPWCHCGGQDQVVPLLLQWFQRWLQDRPAEGAHLRRILYFTIGAPRGQEWRESEVWPPVGTETRTLFLAAGTSGSGTLTPLPPEAIPDDADSRDRLIADHEASSGSNSRWANINGVPFGYRDRAANERWGLTYTGAPLETSLEITGHPLVHLWIGSEWPDGAFFVYLEAVRPDGYCQYVSEGTLCASHRSRTDPHHDRLGLPYHPGTAESMMPLGTAPAELVIDLQPISFVFRAGDRIRLSIVCADRDNAEIPGDLDGAAYDLHRSAALPSRLILPVSPPGAATTVDIRNFKLF